MPRQVQWEFADRFELQMLVQSARAVARGPVARLVAEGGRNSHEWTEGKGELLEAFDSSGIKAVLMEPEEGGLFAGPENLALALVAFDWHGWTVVRRQRALRDVWLWLLFTSGEPPNSRVTTWAWRFRQTGERIASRYKGRFA